MGKLAVSGGVPVRDISAQPWPSWPLWDDVEKESLLEVLNSGVWAYNGPKEMAFCHSWAEYCGTKYALAVSNGTVAIQLALEALDIGYGDEVIVPGCTWQATAAAVIDINAVPVMVDIEPDTWCIDPAAFEAAITDKTRAVVPVHLYGNISDMDAVLEVAKRHDLAVIEDCAHQHGSEWKGKKIGSLGDIGTFSMQLSKVLSAGEGGALTTSQFELWEKLDALRNCGRRPEINSDDIDKGAGQYGLEGDLIQSGNYRLTDFQAAILLGGLSRLPSQNKVREDNAKYLNSELNWIPGIVPMKQDSRTTRQAYFNIAFRYHQAEFGSLPIDKFRIALAAELGCEVEPCYQPLNDCTLYRPHTKKRYRINQEHWEAINPSRFYLPVCQKVFNEESVVLHHRVLMGTKADIDQIVKAINKIKSHQEEL